MARYRCYFLGSNGQLVCAENIDSDDDETALTRARQLFATKAYASGFELTQGERQVGILAVEVS